MLDGVGYFFSFLVGTGEAKGSRSESSSSSITADIAQRALSKGSGRHNSVESLSGREGQVKDSCEDLNAAIASFNSLEFDASGKFHLPPALSSDLETLQKNLAVKTKIQELIGLLKGRTVTLQQVQSKVSELQTAVNKGKVEGVKEEINSEKKNFRTREIIYSNRGVLSLNQGTSSSCELFATPKVLYKNLLGVAYKIVLLGVGEFGSSLGSYFWYFCQEGEIAQLRRDFALSRMCHAVGNIGVGLIEGIPVIRRIFWCCRVLANREIKSDGTRESFWEAKERLIIEPFQAKSFYFGSEIRVMPYKAVSKAIKLRQSGLASRGEIPSGNGGSGTSSIVSPTRQDSFSVDDEIDTNFVNVISPEGNVNPDRFADLLFGSNQADRQDSFTSSSEQ